MTFPSHTGMEAGNSMRSPVEETSQVCPPKYRADIGSKTFKGRCWRMPNPRRGSEGTASVLDERSLLGCAICSMASYPGLRQRLTSILVIGTPRSELRENLLFFQPNRYETRAGPRQPRHFRPF